MVQIGDFTVNLVSADTKEVFKEHTGPDNSVYAEVEPDIEYFIQVASTRGEVIITTKVDGVDLGYTKSLGKPAKGKIIGSWERKNGESKTTALRFNRAARATKEEGHTNPSMLTGKVELQFYERGAQTGVRDFSDYAPKQLSRDMKVGGKKCVLSGNGSHVVKRKRSKSTSRHYRGRRLCTITLHYCTAMGLILNKILDAPPSSQPAPLVPAPLVDNEADNEHPRGEEKRHRQLAAALKRQPLERKLFDSAIDVDDDDDDDIMSVLVASNSNETILPSLGIKRARRGQKSVKPEKVKPEKKRSAAAALLDEKESNKKVAALIDLTGDDDDGGNERWL